MKNLIKILILIILVIVGLFWWSQKNQPIEEEEPKQDIVTWVDRGIDEEGWKFFDKQFEERMAAIKAAEEKGERDIHAILLLGNYYYQIGELAKSVEQYDDILSTNPNDAPALENKGQSLYEMKDYEGAEKVWLRAVQINPYQVTYLRLWKLYTENLEDRNAETLVILEEAVATLGQTEGFMIALGHWYRDNKMYEEAISHYNIALQLNPENTDIADIIKELQTELEKQMRGSAKKNERF